MTDPKTYTRQVPGKLYLAGEYAVLAPHHPAILFAVDRYLTAHFVPNDRPFIELNNSLADYPKLGLPLSEINRPSQGPWRYVQSALKVSQQYLKERGLDMQGGKMTFQSDLVDDQGQKYGLGSSGAVTIATLEVILAAHQLPLDPLTIYKLAVLAHLSLHKKGSFGDLAASTLGGWIYYQAPDSSWLHDQIRQKNSLLDLVTCEWPLLTIEPLDFPADLELIVGWTQRPASTDQLVQNLSQHLDPHDQAYQAFLDQAGKIVLCLKTSFETKDNQGIRLAIHAYRQALIGLSQAYQFPIETPNLRELVEIANQYNYDGKSSGAGNGDCGLAIGENPQAIPAIYQSWLDHQIQPLDLQVAGPRYPERSSS